MDRLAAAEHTAELAASQNGPIVLGGSPARVILSSPPTVGMLAQRLRGLSPSDQVYLVLVGIDTEIQPGITYNVFIGLPESVAQAGPGDPHYVGTFSFFNAGPSRNAVFNVTKKIKDDSGLLGDHPTITVIPAGVPQAGAKPTIGKVTLIVNSQ